MDIGVRVKQELDQLACSMDTSHSSCMREAITQNLPTGANYCPTGLFDRMTALFLPMGLVVTVASAGAYSGQPRPAVVVQTNRAAKQSERDSLPTHKHPVGHRACKDSYAPKWIKWDDQILATVGRGRQQFTVQLPLSALCGESGSRYL